MTTPTKPVQWILDTRSWFPQATQTHHLETQASKPLSLLTPTERTQILKYYHLRDAKLSLASHLLKRFCIAKLAPSSPSWPLTLPTRDPVTTKPIWIDPQTQTSPVSFNVSHQAGLVSLIAFPSTTAQLGVDIVCTSERRERDLEQIDRSGWSSFVNTHEDVFSPNEVKYLKYHLPRSYRIDGKLREFYALWALREAYIKLTGEALLASWLRELEFREFRAPKPTESFDVPADDESDQVVREFDIRFKGEKVENVNVCLRSLGPDYMIATAVKTPENEAEALGWKLGPYEFLTLEEIIEFAESRS
ncbi:L-aminoadipate-semialdehyde dehydrogenase-phosphopantetheinyl transferase [Podospora fimiseda]|uniref:holo-[acyl-carrier-protein] synthase n=1 Tax=Podospora fimiseda TaxID=252190 RepID=A0AAN7H3I3_9PEZI|nr:L-aminoadipate-semialdehyde dehydrogenase-phosphopantetheinyl transferase [Podospora fimiseda]